MIGAIILGIIAGFIARALMPGKDPMGFFATILLGLAGALVGFFLFTELLGIGDTDMFDLGGLVGAIIGAMILLGIYRMVVGRNQRRAASGRPRRSHLSSARPDRRRQPLTTPIGRSSATRAARPARSTTSTTRSTSL